MRILIVEDDEDSRIYLQRALASNGYEVDVAEDGLVALNAAHHAAPDIIISDIMMPRMDGYELCRNIKENEDLKGIPFIFYTATYLSSQDRELGLALGASLYLDKPMELSNLLKAINDEMEKVGPAPLTAPTKSEFDIDDVYKKVLARKLDKKVAQLEKQYRISQEAQQLLRESEEKFKDFAESSSDWFWEMDEDLRFTNVSKGFQSFTGHDPRTIIGQKRHDISAENTADKKWLQHIDDLKNHRSFSNFIYELDNSEGTRLTVRANGIPVFDHEEIFRGYRGTETDISEQRRAEKHLMEAKEEAEHANMAKSEFLASMSHELRTPLNAILGFAQLLQCSSQSALSPKQDTYISSILEGGNHLLGLVNEVLDLSRIESGQFDLSLEDVDANEVVVDCLSLTSPLAKAREITIIDLFSTGPLAVLYTDQVRLKQVILNLVSNAVNFNKDGGTVTVSGQKIDEDFLRITVTDTGVGIAKNDFKKVFHMFHRLNADPMIAREGTGIGLTVTKHLIDQMAGRIGFNSEEGVGSTFWIELPLATNEGVLVKSTN